MLARVAGARARMVTSSVTSGNPISDSTALVHDYLLVLRGAERTFAAIADLFPAAPVFTTLYSEEGTGGRFASREVAQSWLSRFGVGQQGFRRLLPLYAGAVERLPVSGFELVVSSSSAFAHGVRPASNAVHVCYCHSPFRYAWHERTRALEETPRLLRPAMSRFLDRARRWDLEATRRVSAYIANSAITKSRIADFYGRDSVIVHPPVEVERFSPEAPEDYVLVVGELVRHKRIEVALEAAGLAQVPVKVVGTGPDLERLRSRFPAAEFLGRVSDSELAGTYARALALIVPNVEEFGIAAVEAQAAGRPVVAVAEGGATETVRDGETGFLVDGDRPADLAAALEPDVLGRFDSARIVRHASGFSHERFARELQAAIADACAFRPGSP
jgi:glycosyltransferase involved in cell wall biosynthesis